MSELLRSIDALVREGIQAYIGLLCCGEKERSRRLFSDVLQISSFAAGGPSARLPVSLGEDRRDIRSCACGASGSVRCDSAGATGSTKCGCDESNDGARCGCTATNLGDRTGNQSTDEAEAGRRALARCMIYFTLRSVLASLLVLRATAYWQKVPALVRLHLACAQLSKTLGDGVFGMEQDEPGAIPARTSG